MICILPVSYRLKELPLKVFVSLSVNRGQMISGRFVLIQNFLFMIHYNTFLLIGPRAFESFRTALMKIEKGYLVKELDKVAINEDELEAFHKGM